MMEDKIDAVLQRLGLLKPSEELEELKNLAQALKSNEAFRVVCLEEMRQSFRNLSSLDPNIEKWGEDFKNSVDEFVRLAREKQRLRQRLDELKARL